VSLPIYIFLFGMCLVVLMLGAGFAPVPTRKCPQCTRDIPQSSRSCRGCGYAGFKG
jgi:hypothetical protein